MKTVKEKAKEFCSVNGLPKWVDDKLELLLKEQDRDTRHACAEAVLMCVNITPDSAHEACMNVRAV